MSMTTLHIDLLGNGVCLLCAARLPPDDDPNPHPYMARSTTLEHYIKYIRDHADCFEPCVPRALLTDLPELIAKVEESLHGDDRGQVEAAIASAAGALAPVLRQRKVQIKTAICPVCCGVAGVDPPCVCPGANAPPPCQQHHAACEAVIQRADSAQAELKAVRKQAAEMWERLWWHDGNHPAGCKGHIGDECYEGHPDRARCKCVKPPNPFADPAAGAL